MESNIDNRTYRFIIQLTVMVLKVVKCYNIDVLKEEWRLLLKS